jgi:hypothetical protein
MLPPKLIHLIENQWDEIVTRGIRAMLRDPEVIHFRSLPEAELREWGRNILENLGHWLAASKDDEVARRYEAVGRLRFEEHVPLHESVRALCLLKEKVLDFVQEQGSAKTSVDLFAEEELEHRLGHFFDLILVHQVRGYEMALRHSTTHVAG